MTAVFSENELARIRQQEQYNQWQSQAYVSALYPSTGLEVDYCHRCGQVYRTEYCLYHRCGTPDLGSPYYMRPRTAEEEKKLNEERARVMAEQKKREEKEEEEARLRKLNWKMSDLDNDKKKEYLDLVRKVYRRYELERGWQQIMSGLKWFFILLGFAILINFTQILEIIKLAIGK